MEQPPNIRAQLSNSLGGFWKGQTFACFVFLSSRFHEPIQFPSRLSVLLHLPVPIIIFDWIKQSSQFTTLFRTKLLDRSLDFFHPAHAPSVPVKRNFRQQQSNPRMPLVLSTRDAPSRAGEHLTSNRADGGHSAVANIAASAAFN